MSYTTTPGAKMQYLIKRRPETSREELVANWFANHMPAVIERMASAEAGGHAAASRYIATLFDPVDGGEHVWDGVAQLWWDEATPKPSEPHGTTPADTFQQKAMPYVPWATTEHVILDGSERLPVQPNTLNDPFPCSRSGFVKVIAMLAAKPGADAAAMGAHWLDVHAPNVVSVLNEVGGWRYVISLSNEPADEPFVGMAELYFDEMSQWTSFNEKLTDDGLGDYIDGKASVMVTSTTELIGIPG